MTDLTTAIELARTRVFFTVDNSVDAIKLSNGETVVVAHDGAYSFALTPESVLKWAETPYDGYESYQDFCDRTEVIEDPRVARELYEKHDKYVRDSSTQLIYDDDIPAEADFMVPAIEVETVECATEAGCSLIWVAGDVILGGWMNNDRDAFEDAIREELGADDEEEDAVLNIEIEEVPYS